MSLCISHTTPRMPPDWRPPIDTTKLWDLMAQFAARFLFEVLISRTTMFALVLHAAAIAAAALANQQSSPAPPPRIGVPLMFGAQLDDEPLPWPTFAEPPRLVYQPVDTQQVVTRTVQDPALQEELELARAELRAVRGANSRLNDRLGELDSELTNASDSGQLAQIALDAMTRERNRLEEQLAEALRPPDRQRIGTFRGIMNVYQSPPPGYEYVGENIRISTYTTRRGVDAEDTNWSVSCGTAVGGNSGRTFTFRPHTPGRCVVTARRGREMESYVVIVNNER